MNCSKIFNLTFSEVGIPKFVVKPVSILESSKLVSHETSENRAKLASRDDDLGNAGHEQINVVKNSEK